MNYSKQAQPEGFSSQWWLRLGEKISQQHCTLCLREEALQKRNNLLGFLWFGKISCPCGQLSLGGGFSWAILLLHLQGWREAPVRTDKAPPLCPGTGELSSPSSCVWVVSPLTPRPRENQGRLQNRPGCSFAGKCQWKAIGITMFSLCEPPPQQSFHRTGRKPCSVSLLER